MHTFETLSVPANAVGIHWFGQNSFALKDTAGTIVQIDPYFPRERSPERFVHTEPPLDEAELKQLVADKLASVGKSRIGLALRFTEAMNDDRFIRSEDALVALNPEETSV